MDQGNISPCFAAENGFFTDVTEQAEDMERSTCASDSADSESGEDRCESCNDTDTEPEDAIQDDGNVASLPIAFEGPWIVKCVSGWVHQACKLPDGECAHVLQCMMAVKLGKLIGNGE